MNLQIPGPILDILNRCRKKIHRKHKDPDGEFQDTQELAALSQEDLSRPPEDHEDFPKDDAFYGDDMEIPEDEEEAGDEAKTLKSKHIKVAAAIVASVGVVAVAANGLGLFSGNDAQQTKKSSMQTANVAPDGTGDLPSSYSDIAKYQDKDGRGGPVNGQTSKMPGNKAASGSSAQDQSPVQGSGYREKYASQNTPARSAAPAAAPARSTSSGSGGTTVSVKSAASQEDKAAEEAAKEESAAMTSSIAFQRAVAATRAASSQQNTADSTSGTGVAAASDDVTYSDGEDEAMGLYAIQAGTVIPATLVTGVTSDVPGADVIAEVRQNV